MLITSNKRLSTTARAERIEPVTAGAELDALRLLYGCSKKLRG